MANAIDPKVLMGRLMPLIVAEGAVVTALGAAFVISGKMIYVYSLVGAAVVFGGLIVFQIFQARTESDGELRR